MRRSARLLQIVAIAILVLATGETVFCAQCSPETCRFAHSQKSTGVQPGNGCLRCCGHMLAAASPRINPSMVTNSTRCVPVLPLQSVPPAAVYHPPQG